MDPQDTSYSQPMPPQPPSSKDDNENKFAFLKNRRFLLITGVVLSLLVVIAGIIVIVTDNSNNQQPTDELAQEEREYEQQKEQLRSLGQPNAIVLYGAQSESGIDIFAFDLQNTQEYLITQLPSNIKQVTPISENQLLYLDQTDELDFAKRLNIRSLDDDSSSIIYELIDEYYIDGYVVSPDRSYVVTWEVKKGPTGSLQGGNSRLRSIDLTDSSNTTTIVDQVVSPNNPIFYPVLATNDRRVYMDTFLPNSGAGWAYGMSIADIETGNIQTIPSMTNGTYSSRPIASPDGTEILFAGYDGARGDGAENIDGYRRALVFANTIELLDTSTNQRQQLPNLPDGNTYLRLKWGSSDNSIIYAALDAESNSIESAYNITQATTQQIDNSSDIIVTSQLDSNTFLQGTISESSPNYLSNLASNTIYQYTYTSLEVTDITQNNTATIPTSPPFVQYIDTIYTTGSNIQSNAQIQQSFLDDLDNIIDFGELIEGSSRRLQLTTFQVPTPIERDIITEPEPEREPQPTQPSPTPTESVGFNPVPQDPNPTNPPPPPSTSKNCHDIVDPICQAKHPAPSYNDPDWPDFQECRRKLSKEYMADGKCDWTPLYLYGPQGLEVDVVFHTSIFNSNVPTKNGAYSLELLKDGQFISQKKKYHSISSDYKPARTVKPPIYGKVVSKENVKDTVEEYAKRLGLNTRETYDLTTDIFSKVSAPYAFISFYSQVASKYLLPITFDPIPDTYINYVFYVDNLITPQDLGYTPQEPEFEKPATRGEFTAVEVSVISD